MSVPHALLGLLEREPHHGYDLKRLHDAYFAPDKPLAYAQVYSTLGRMEARGQVRLEGVERVDGPDRRNFSITDGGREELERWLTEPLDPEPHLQAALFTKVVLAILSGRPVAPLVDSERHAHLKRMRELTVIRREAPLQIALLSDYCLFHLEADLRWLEATAARVDELKAQLMNIKETR
jgi:DNA-binding PadR family transcriptional regulator